jgi:hypothetical protein
MSVTLAVKRNGPVVCVTAASDLTGSVNYHWWIDGVYLGSGSAPSRDFYIMAGEQARIDVIYTTDADFDPNENRPDVPETRQRLQWTLGVDLQATIWRIDEQTDGETWNTIAKVAVRTGQWSYEYLTRRLTDLVTYTWRVVPIDECGNERTEVSLGSFICVRLPDMPETTMEFDGVTNRVTIGE